jgi:hypothetical protein
MGDDVRIGVRRVEERRRGWDVRGANRDKAAGSGMLGDGEGAVRLEFPQSDAQRIRKLGTSWKKEWFPRSWAQRFDHMSGGESLARAS